MSITNWTWRSSGTSQQGWVSKSSRAHQLDLNQEHSISMSDVLSHQNSKSAEEPDSPFHIWVFSHFFDIFLFSQQITFVILEHFISHTVILLLYQQVTGPIVDALWGNGHYVQIPVFSLLGGMGGVSSHQSCQLCWRYTAIGIKLNRSNKQIHSHQF